MEENREVAARPQVGGGFGSVGRRGRRKVALCLANGVDEGQDAGGILDSGFGLDAGADIEAERANGLEGLGDVAGVEPASEHEGGPVLELSGVASVADPVPGERAARAARAIGIVDVEEDGPREVGMGRIAPSGWAG